MTPLQTPLMEDVTAIENWLSREVAAGSFLGATRVTGEGRELWVMDWGFPSACKDYRALEAEFTAGCPGVFALRMLVTVRERIDDPMDWLAAGFADHGFQCHQVNPRKRQTLSTMLKSMLPRSPAEAATVITNPWRLTCWGPELLLSTTTLPRGLLAALVTRFTFALEDVLNRRLQEGTTKPV
jgi:hypothetical protein